MYFKRSLHHEKIDKWGCINSYEVTACIYSSYIMIFRYKFIHMLKHGFILHVVNYRS